MAHVVISRNGDIEENKWNGQKIKKNYFPYLGVRPTETHLC